WIEQQPPVRREVLAPAERQGVALDLVAEAQLVLEQVARGALGAGALEGREQHAGDTRLRYRDHLPAEEGRVDERVLVVDLVREVEAGSDLDAYPGGIGPRHARRVGRKRQQRDAGDDPNRQI